MKDIAASLAKAEELGGKRIMDPIPIPDVGQVVMFTDPEGQMMGMIRHQTRADG